MVKSLTLTEAIEMLNECGTNINSTYEEQVLDLINEAFNRDVPYQPQLTDSGYYACKCTRKVNGFYLYCPQCGQKLDWSDEI